MTSLRCQGRANRPGKYTSVYCFLTDVHVLHSGTVATVTVPACIWTIESPASVHSPHSTAGALPQQQPAASYNPITGRPLVGRVRVLYSSRRRLPINFVHLNAITHFDDTFFPPLTRGVSSGRGHGRSAVLATASVTRVGI